MDVGPKINIYANRDELARALSWTTNDRKKVKSDDTEQEQENC